MIRLAGPTFPGVSQKFSLFFNYNYNICILLIKTNLMIYICYIFCVGGVQICLLTVRDDEHDLGDNVGDNDRMLPRKGMEHWRRRSRTSERLGISGTPGGLHFTAVI